MEDVLETMRADRVVAVVRARKITDPAGLAEALAAGGIRCVELTFTIPDVADVIRAAASARAYIGAGTVLDVAQARAVIDAGASFVVSPACRPQLVETCRAHNLPVFLGAFTPTEVADAVSAGTTAVKLFPARLGGPSYIRDLRGPFPDVDFIPSGGVSAANAADYFAAGCPTVYAGSGLCPPELIERGDLDEIARRARAFTDAIG